MAIDSPLTDGEFGATEIQATNLLSGTRWMEWLEELRRIPAVSLEWSQIEIFFTEARALADEKAQVREQEFIHLQQALDDLRTNCNEYLRFFEYDDVASWQVKCCPVEERNTCTANVREFHGLLLQYWDFDKQIAQADNFRLRKELRTQLDVIEKDISEVHKALAMQLVATHELIPTPPDDRGNMLPSEPEAGIDEDSPGDSEEIEYIAPPSSIDTPEFNFHDTTGDIHLPCDETDLAPNSVRTLAETITVGEDGPENTNVIEQISQPSISEAPTAKLPDNTGIIQRLRERADLLPGVVRAPSEIASWLIADEPSELWYDLCWALIAEGEIASAYLLATACEGIDYRPHIQPWLLAALQGSLWLSADSDLFVEDLRAIISEHTNIQQLSPAETMLALSAVLNVALLAPSSEMHHWLHCPRSMPAIAGVVNAIDEFMHNGTLRQNINTALPACEEFLAGVISQRTDIAQYAASLCLARSCEYMRNLLGLPSTDHVFSGKYPSISYWQIDGVDNLEQALHRQLLIFPEVTVNANDELQVSSHADLINSLRDAYATGRTLEMAFEKWIEKQDFRFITQIIEAMSDQNGVYYYQWRYREELDKARLTLREDVSNALVAIERAAVDGSITEEERARYSNQVEAIDVEAAVNFFELRHQLQFMLSTLGTPEPVPVFR